MLLIENFIHLFVESAPYLLLGMLLAGIINQFVPKSWINKVLGKDASVVTASVIGAPLPLCSCSVIPVAMGLRQQGASKASTASFLVATPETGVDSVGITYALMGPIMAIARPFSAIFSAIVAGVGIKLFGVEEAPTPATTTSCCQKSCGSKETPPKKSTTSASLVTAVKYGFGKLLRDFMTWLLIGLAFAAAIQTFVPANAMAQYGDGLGAMLVMVLISIPMYICATASTPVAVGMMMSGISPGAALVFMLTGPATNIATLMVVKKQLGTRELVIYLSAVIISALLCGYGLNVLIEAMSWKIDVQTGGHGEMTNLLYQVSAVLLAVLITVQYGKVLREKLFTKEQRAEVS